MGLRTAHVCAHPIRHLVITSGGFTAGRAVDRPVLAHRVQVEHLTVYSLDNSDADGALALIEGQVDYLRELDYYLPDSISRESQLFIACGVLTEAASCRSIAATFAVVSRFDWSVCSPADAGTVNAVGCTGNICVWKTARVVSVDSDGTRYGVRGAAGDFCHATLTRS